MAAPLPFARVAILSPELTFSQPQNPVCDTQMLGELRAWWAIAQARGADAAYPRVSFMPAGAALLQAMAELDTYLIAPARNYSHDLQPPAWHYMSSDYRNGLDVDWNALAGCSTHSLAELQIAEKLGFDYAFLSPVFSTATHPEAIPLGLEALEMACKAVQIPVIALGGIDLHNADQCLQAGAAGWAGIRCWL